MGVSPGVLGIGLLGMEEGVAPAGGGAVPDAPGTGSAAGGIFVIAEFGSGIGGSAVNGLVRVEAGAPLA
jgi:hypothetical protein